MLGRGRVVAPVAPAYLMPADPMFRALCIACLVAFLGDAAWAEGPAVMSAKADPSSIELSSSSARQTILVDGHTADGRVIDLTRQARFRTVAPKIVEVSAAGIVRGLADGQGTIEVTA